MKTLILDKIIKVVKAEIKLPRVKQRGRPCIYKPKTIAVMFAVMMVKRIVHFKSMHKFLITNPDIAKLLGFKASISDRSTLSRRFKGVYEFIKKQHDDLVQAIEDLRKVIRKIDRITRERFLQTFEAVNVKLSEVFPRLFEGGAAKLVMTHPDKPLETGLEFLVHPPGKKLTRLTLLSGGEKALSAIAFIFAIQNYDPSPFYVLDEVDMFLDGLNAENVSRMVKSNSNDSQFIMVSLRKVALKEANHVYGVTMRDTGVSDMIGNIDPSTVSPKGDFKSEGGKMIAAA